MPEAAGDLDRQNRQLEEAERHFESLQRGAERIGAATAPSEPWTMATGEDRTFFDQPGVRDIERRFDESRSRLAQLEREGVTGLEEAQKAKDRMYSLIGQELPMSRGGQAQQRAGVRGAQRDLDVELEAFAPAEAEGPSAAQAVGMARGGLGGIVQMLGANPELIVAGAVAVAALEKVKQQFSDMSEAAERLTAGPLGGVSQSFANVATGIAQTFEGRPFAAISSFQQGAMQMMGAASTAARGIPAEISAMGMGGWDPMTAGGTQRAFDILGGPGTAAQFGEFGNRPELFGARAGAIYGAGVNTPAEAMEAASRRPMTLSPSEQMQEQFVWGEMAADIHRLTYLSEEQRDRAMQILTRGERMTPKELGDIAFSGLQADAVMQDWRQTQAQAIGDMKPVFDMIGGMEKDLTGLVGGGAGLIGKHGKGLMEGLGAAEFIGGAMTLNAPLALMGILTEWAASHWGKDAGGAGHSSDEGNVTINGERVGTVVGRSISSQRSRAVVLGG